MHDPLPALPNKVAALASSQRFLLWAVRCWVCCCKANCLPAAPVERAFGLVGMDSAAFHLDDVLRLIAHATLRPLSFHCPCYPDLSDDEMLLLTVAGLMQHQAVGSAQRLLDDWLEPLATESVVDRLNRLVATMSFAGLLLPEADPQGCEPRCIETEAPALLH